MICNDTKTKFKFSLSSLNFFHMQHGVCQQLQIHSVADYLASEMQLTTIALLLTFGCRQTLETRLTSSIKIAEHIETPSPEWIKYQQERNDPIHNKRKLTNPQDQSTVNPTLAIHMQKESSQIKNTNKDDTSSRQSGDSHKSSNTKQSNDSHKNINTQKDTHTTEEDHDQEEDETVEFEDPNEFGLQYPSLTGFIQFIKSLHRNWVKNSLDRFENKIEYLHKLKRNLMRAIEDRFFALWPDADPDADQELIETENEERHLRQKRGILDESSINFPPEYALMSINFLTFAVFLIKLVMQVVNIIKSKHYQFNAFGLNAENLTKG